MYAACQWGNEHTANNSLTACLEEPSSARVSTHILQQPKSTNWAKYFCWNFQDSLNNDDDDLYVRMSVPRNKFFTMKPTDAIIYTFILVHKSTCFGQFLCQSPGVFHCTFGTGTCYTGLTTACVQDLDVTAVASWSYTQAVLQTRFSLQGRVVRHTVQTWIS